jgi:hypothetical protein
VKSLVYVSEFPLLKEIKTQNIRNLTDKINKERIMKEKRKEGKKECR